MPTERGTTLILFLFLSAAGCGTGPDARNGETDSPSATTDPPRPSPVDAVAGGTGGREPELVDLIDPSIPPAVAGSEGWNFQQRADADLNGDGRIERVVLTARVEMIRGRPAWDDGQPWQIYVEAPDGSRTYLYAQRLQLGTVAMRVTLSEPERPATIVLLEHLPDRISVYEATYRGPGEVSVAVHFQRNLDPRGELAGPDYP